MVVPVRNSDGSLAVVALNSLRTGIRVFVVVLHSVSVVAVGIGLLGESWFNTWCLVADWETGWVLSVIVSWLNNLGRVMLMMTFRMDTSGSTTTTETYATEKEEENGHDDASNNCTSSSSNHSSWTSIGTIAKTIVAITTSNRDMSWTSITSIARITWLIIASRWSICRCDRFWRRTVCCLSENKFCEQWG